MSRRRTAFTLVEVLVVIGIIALGCIAFADGHAAAQAFSDYATTRSWDWRIK